MFLSAAEYLIVLSDFTAFCSVILLKYFDPSLVNSRRDQLPLLSFNCYVCLPYLRLIFYSGFLAATWVKFEERILKYSYMHSLLCALPLCMDQVTYSKEQILSFHCP